MGKLVVIALIGALALVAFGCSSGDDDSESAGGEARPVMEDAGASEGASQGADDVQAVPASLPAVGPSIVQTASLAISVPRNQFDSTIQRARTIATGSGGFVISSSASQGEDQRLVTGTLVVRVPERVYARVMEQQAWKGVEPLGHLTTSSWLPPARMDRPLGKGAKGVRGRATGCGVRGRARRGL